MVLANTIQGLGWGGSGRVLTKVKRLVLFFVHNQTTELRSDGRDSRAAI